MSRGCREIYICTYGSSSGNKEGRGRDESSEMHVWIEVSSWISLTVADERILEENYELTE